MRLSRTYKVLAYFFENILLVMLEYLRPGSRVQIGAESTVRLRYVCEGVFVVGGIS